MNEKRGNSEPKVRQGMLAETFVELGRYLWQLGSRKEGKGLRQQASFKEMLPVI